MTTRHSGSKSWSRKLGWPGAVRGLSHPAADAVKVADAVEVAEQRFRREFDRQSGSDLVPALRAPQNASESGESDLTKDEITLAKRWIKGLRSGQDGGLSRSGRYRRSLFSRSCGVR